MALVPMKVKTVVVGVGPVSSMLLLSEKSGEGGVVRQLPIMVGRAEASAIGMASSENEPPRPMTHDLLLSSVEALGAKVTGVAIVDVLETTFFARVDMLDAAGASVSVDARPSDAIALAVRADAPVYVDEQVLDTAALPMLAGEEDDEPRGGDGGRPVMGKRDQNNTPTSEA